MAGTPIDTPKDKNQVTMQEKTYAARTEAEPHLGGVQLRGVGGQPDLGQPVRVGADEPPHRGADVSSEVDPGRGSGLVDRPVSPDRFPHPACPFPGTGRSASPVQDLRVVLIPGSATGLG